MLPRCMPGSLHSHAPLDRLLLEEAAAAECTIMRVANQALRPDAPLLRLPPPQVRLLPPPPLPIGRHLRMPMLEYENMVLVLAGA